MKNNNIKCKKLTKNPTTILYFSSPCSHLLSNEPQHMGQLGHII